MMEACRWAGAHPERRPCRSKKTLLRYCCKVLFILSREILNRQIHSSIVILSRMLFNPAHNILLHYFMIFFVQNFMPCSGIQFH